MGESAGAGVSCSASCAQFTAVTHGASAYLSLHCCTRGPDQALLLCASGAAVAPMLSRVSGSISEPDTPPSDLEDSKKDPRSVRRVGSVDGRQTPPPRVHSAGHPKPRVAPQQPESEDVAATLMALMVTSTAAQEAPSSVTQDAPGSPAASSSSVKKPTRKRKRDGKPAPTQQPKREMSVADDRAVFQPSASQLMQLVSSGVVPHFAIFTHGPSGHSTAAFGQPQASGPVWRTAPQSHQPMVS